MSLLKLTIAVSNGTIKKQLFQNKWFSKFRKIQRKTFWSLFINPLNNMGVFIRQMIIHVSHQRRIYASTKLATWQP